VDFEARVLEAPSFRTDGNGSGEIRAAQAYWIRNEFESALKLFAWFSHATTPFANCGFVLSFRYFLLQDSICRDGEVDCDFGLGLDGIGT
jgi:hypothetical protein